MVQLNFPIALKIKAKFPLGRTSTEGAMVCRCDNNIDYVIKSDLHGKKVRASEWIAYFLAGRVGVPVPAHQIVMEPGNQCTYFGSMYIDNPSNDFDLVEAIENSSVLECPETLSRIYALDLFLHNFDRHEGNYRVSPQNGSLRIFSIDYGKSVFFDWPNLPSAFHSSHNTRVHFDWWHSILGFRHEQALDVFNRLCNISEVALSDAIGQMPDGWLDPTTAEEFVNWWKESRTHRIDEQARWIATEYGT